MLKVADVHVSFGPDGPAALDGVSLTVRPGEIVALAGTNGSGKTTLGRVASGALLADAGRVRADGLDPAADAASCRAVRRLVGRVQQDPRNQLVAARVSEEVAFGPRNLRLSEDEVAARVERALDRTGLAGMGSRAVSELSGGEQQRLAVAGVLALAPHYLVLDEACAQLDAAARPAFRALFHALAHEEGLGVLEIAHDTDELLVADRVVVMDGGRAVWEGGPDALLRSDETAVRRVLGDDPFLDALRSAAARGYSLGGAAREEAAAPQEGDPAREAAAPSTAHAPARERGEGPSRLRWAVGGPVDVVDGDASAYRVAGEGAPAGAGRLETWLADGLAAGRLDLRDACAVAAPVLAATCVPDRGVSSPAADGSLRLAGISYAYGDRSVLRDLSLSLRPGRVTLIAGRSGSGKTTLLEVAAGLLAPAAGAVTLAGRPVRAGACAVAFQRPEDQFFLDTVLDELMFAPLNAGCDEHEAERRARVAAGRLGLDDDLLAHSPYELSGGQARRVAIAAALSQPAGAFLLDEPTAGLDAPARAAVRRLAREVARGGLPVAVVSHDLDEWARAADDAVLLDAGAVAWEGPARELARDPGLLARCELTAPPALALAAAACRRGWDIGSREAGRS